MFLSLVVLNFFHPGRYLIGSESEFPRKPSRKEKKAVKKEAKAQKKADREQTKAEKIERKERKANRKSDRNHGGYIMESVPAKY